MLAFDVLFWVVLGLLLGSFGFLLNRGRERWGQSVVDTLVGAAAGGILGRIIDLGATTDAFSVLALLTSITGASLVVAYAWFSHRRPRLRI